MVEPSGSKVVHRCLLQGLSSQYSFPLSPNLGNTTAPQLQNKPRTLNPGRFLLILLRASREPFNTLANGRMSREKVADASGRERLDNKKMRRGRRCYQRDPL